MIEARTTILDIPSGARRAAQDSLRDEEGRVAKPTDVWRELTSTVVELMRDLKAEGETRSPEEIADAALSAFLDVPGIEGYRERLVQLVRDISSAH